MAGSQEPFVAPTDEQVRTHLDRHAPREPSRLHAWLPLLGLGLVVGAAVALAGTVLAMLPWLLLLGLFIAFGFRDRRMRRLEQRVNEIYELTVLRQSQDAVRRAWRTLPSVTVAPPLYGRTVALLAHNLDHLRRYDAAIVAYDRLLDNLPRSHPWAIQLLIQRTMAQLASDQLTSADDALRRLRGLVDSMADATTRAALRLANLIQQVQTYHWSDAVEGADNLVDELRPLGVEAGFGHALVALSYHQMAGSDSSGDASPRMSEQAALWWRRATMLMSPPALIDRFPQLAPVAQVLPARSRPNLEQA